MRTQHSLERQVKSWHYAAKNSASRPLHLDQAQQLVKRPLRFAKRERLAGQADICHNAISGGRRSMSVSVANINQQNHMGAEAAMPLTKFEVSTWFA